MREIAVYSHLHRNRIPDLLSTDAYEAVSKNQNYILYGRNSALTSIMCNNGCVCLDHQTLGSNI